MTRPIQRLPDTVINRIAAGEVVERPSSAIKELLENSIDAGATSIQVEALEGGKDFFRVVDDGCGIPREELPLAVERHATSKILDAEDLFRVRSLGFRGEALSSIASVSEFSLRSRPDGQDTGNEILIRHGEIEAIRACGCPKGTQIEVRNLFGSVPVRRKFLKSKQTELGHIMDAMTRTGLAYPHVALRLTHNERVALDRPAGLDRAESIRSLFGDEVGDALIPFDTERDGYHIFGYAVDPRIDRPTNKSQYIFVNGRFIRDRSLSHSLTEAYRGLLLTGRYPMAFVFIEMPADQVDVNVHPMKSEVRFQDSHRIFSQMLSSIRTRFLASDMTARLRVGPDNTSQPQAPNAFHQTSSQPMQDSKEAINREFQLAFERTPSPPTLWQEAPSPVHEGDYRSAEPPRIGAQEFSAALGLLHAPGIDSQSFAPSGRIAERRSESSSSFSGDPPFSLSPSQPMARSVPMEFPSPEYPTPAQRTADPSGWRNDSQQHSTAADSYAAPVRLHAPDPVRPAIQLHNSYLVVETEEGMLVIDQHALHERVIYERLRERTSKGGLEIQELLVPEPVELSPLQVGLLIDQQEVLARLGIKIEDFGTKCVLLTARPVMLDKVPPDELVLGLATRLEETGKTPSQDEMLEELLHMVACKAAVKAGDPLTGPEIDQLIQSRHLVEDSHHCPHGRPTTLRFTLKDLEKQFKRI